MYVLGEGAFSLDVRALSSRGFVGFRVPTLNPKP